MGDLRKRCGELKFVLTYYTICGTKDGVSIGSVANQRVLMVHCMVRRRDSMIDLGVMPREGYGRRSQCV